MPYDDRAEAEKLLQTLEGLAPWSHISAPAGFVDRLRNALLEAA